MNTAAAKIVRGADELKEALARTARPVVFTNGCFDILHRGHVAYLSEAAELGRTLVVGVNSNASIRRLNKSTDRPFNDLEDRMAVLAALESVDMVVPFDEETPASLIDMVQPDHLVKGGDWAVDDIVGADAVRQRGGQVHAIPLRYDRSTTALVERIRSSAES